MNPLILDNLSTGVKPDAQAGFIDAPIFAALLHVSLATLGRLKSAGKLPRHVELSRGCHRWRRAEIISWMESDCPSRKEWEALREKKGWGP